MDTENILSLTPSPWQPVTDPKTLKHFGKALEELGECASAISRCLIQGVDECSPDTGKINRVWLEEEVADVRTILTFLCSHLSLDESHIALRIDRKTAFLRTWLNPQESTNTPKPLLDDPSRGAVISACGKYRYSLWRTWAYNRGHCTFVMLNPSTADAEVDDRTIRKCMKFAKSWGMGSLEVVNLYAYRATDPNELKGLPCEVAIGPDNLHYLKAAANGANLVVAAWGTKSPWPEVADECARLFRELHCLKVTDGGHPSHPLYLRDDTPLSIYKSPLEVA